MTRPDPRIGRRCVSRVTWPSGNVTETEGEIMAIDEAANEVFLMSEFGPIEVALGTLEIVDEPEEA